MVMMTSIAIRIEALILIIIPTLVPIRISRYDIDVL